MKKLANMVHKYKLWMIVVAAVFLSFGLTKVDLANWHQSDRTNPQVVFTDLTADNISVLLQSKLPIYIEFVNQSIDSSAQQLILNESLQSFVGKITFVRINVQSQPALAKAIEEQVINPFLQTVSMQVPSQYPVPMHLLITISSRSTEPVVLNLGAGIMTAAETQSFVSDGLGRLKAYESQK
ncbi:hypothetical protein BH10CYA1_BH10CYA1_43570 [soil metagenome]